MKACLAFSGVFTPDEIARIRALGDAQTQAPARVLGGNDAIRRCTVAWLKDAWLTERIAELRESINRSFYGFELNWEFTEPFQYTVYGEGCRYGWHMDLGDEIAATRKLSLTVQLSHPTEYEGGDFQAMTGAEVRTLPRAAGQVIAFPSWIIHRVMPVTKGVRRSLVIWAHGPKFV